jgi:hypothetical protein
VIGYGSLAESVHAPLLTRLPNARLVAIAETDPSRRAAAAAGYPAVTMHSDVESLLADPSLQAVVVSLPNSLHARAACAALGAGRHLYENPMALSTSEGREIIDAWRIAGVVGMMGFNYRVNPLYLRLRAAIAARRAGDIAFALASPLIPLVRFARGVGQARRAGLDTSLIARVIPTMLCGLSVDGVRQMVGYAAGAGTSREKMGLFEFHRVDRNRGS